MEPAEIVAEFRARGIELDRDGASLVARPGRKLSETDRRLIREHKAELLALLDKIPGEVWQEIARIESEALRLGWRRERLWNASFWPNSTAQPRGLASVLDPGDRIAEVTSEFALIEKSNSRGDRLRFWRVDG
jgi:hypothetical protein